MIACSHGTTKRFGKDRKGNPRRRCLLCGKTWTIRQPKLLGKMQVPVADAKLALLLLVEGMSIRGTARTTGIAGNTGNRSRSGVEKLVFASRGMHRVG